jgi:diguanylate cyclase
MELIYKQDRDASAEVLRLILQRMGGQPAAFTPHAYAVWYEFLTGVNPPLAEAMRSVVSGDAAFTSEMAQRLFDSFVAEGNDEAQRTFRRNMHRLLDDLARFAELTGRETGRFSDDLQRYGDTLSRTLDQPALKDVINDISRDTRNMRKSVVGLHGKLKESRSEVERLQGELESARSEALVDPMTQVANRRGFDAQIRKLATDPELSGKRAGVLMLDIDHFKKINDTYGHLVGDRVICGIAAALKAQVKGQDIVSRIGGEEFAVVLPDTTLHGACVVAEHVRQRIEQSRIRRLDNQEFIGGVTVSIGVSDCQVDSRAKAAFDAAIARADAALYESKRGGRNRVTVRAEDQAQPPGLRASA